MSWRNDKVTTWTPLEGLQSYHTPNKLPIGKLKEGKDTGDLIGWAFQSTTKDGAWLETDSNRNNQNRR